MSNSRPPNSEMAGATIGFRYHATEEELEEVQSKEDSPDTKEENVYLKMMTDILKPEVLDGGKVVFLNRDTSAEGHKGQRKLGKRSASVDSASEPSFSNPVERWKKFSEFREKITKTVEEKISEIKMDRNALGKTKLVHSKENSSISDSEDTSESSKLSEQFKDVENQILMPEKVTVQNSEALSNALDTTVTDVNEGTNNCEGNSELRNRKSAINLSDLLNLSDIKIAVAKNDDDSSVVDVMLGEVESGVEADEDLNKEESESLVLFDTDPSERGGRGSSDPPLDGSFGSHVPATIYSRKNSLAFWVLFFLYLFMPLPAFVKGCLLSFLLMLVWGTVKDYIQFDDSSQESPFVIPDYKSMPPLKVPKIETSKGVWFNEYEEETYDPDYYSVTNTVPVYLEIEGNILTVSRAKGKIHRRATFDEPEYKLPIISRRVFNLKGCSVYLMPEGLTRKRLFSKKYPIVVLLKRDSLISETKNGKEIEEKDAQECTESEADVTYKPMSPKNKCTLFLFARCDRQKEEWYRRLIGATKYTPTLTQEESHLSPEECEDLDNEVEKTRSDDSPSKEPSTPFENVCFSDDEASTYGEYFHYMAIFANVGKGEEDGEVEEDSASQSQVQWFNAFLNRILFDVFRSPYWLAKIQEKIQRKMNSIRMPYYIEDIEVVEMDLGKTGPMFHRVSSPYIDDRGLWFDMDLTFNGLIRLTVQTQLNLVKLQKGIEENEAAAAAMAAAAAAAAAAAVAASSTSSTTATHHEKPKKGKKSEKSEKTEKSEKIEKDSKSNMYPNLSTEMCSKFSAQSASPEVLAQKLKTIPELESKASDEYTETLMHEVSELAEIAVQEAISGGKEKGSEISCPCPKKEQDGKDCTTCSCPESPKTRSPIYDSDLEDSAESSSEEDEEVIDDRPITGPGNEEHHSTAKRYPKNRRSSKKIFKMFENVAQSKYFRAMAQTKYIQKAIAGVSAAKLRLTIEIRGCVGVLAINIPPPPSDRFWYGFRKMPTLIFSVNPKIGDKSVRFIHIKNYLHKKILYELKKMMVAPNMIDFVLPTSAPARGSSFIQVAETDLQEGTFSE